MQARCIEGKKFSGYHQTPSRGNVFKLVKFRLEKNSLKYMKNWKTNIWSLDFPQIEISNVFSSVFCASKLVFPDLIHSNLNNSPLHMFSVKLNKFFTSSSAWTGVKKTQFYNFLPKSRFQAFVFHFFHTS